MAEGDPVDGPVRAERGPRLPAAVLPLVLALLLVGLVAVAVVLWRDRDVDDAPDTVAADVGGGPRRGELGTSAVVVARDAVERFFSLDHASVDDDIAAAQELMTPEFGTEYVREAAALVEEVRRKQLVLTPSLPEDGTATEYLAPGIARLLVVVDVETSAPGGATDRARYRTRVQLTRRDDTWAVSGIDQVR